MILYQRSLLSYWSRTEGHLVDAIFYYRSYCIAIFSDLVIEHNNKECICIR